MKESYSDRIFNIINFSFIIALLLAVLYPLIYILSSSISSPDAVGSGKIVFFPVGFSLEGYFRIFREKFVMIGYGNTLFYTITGTTLNILLTLPCAYALSKKELPGRGIIMGIFLFTMYFSGGMIPTFMLVRSLGLVNTRAVLIILGAVSVYNVIISRTFFAGIPQELEEAAYIDGCSKTGTFIQIVLPVSKALIGVMVLYYAVAHWNSYFNAMIYVTNDNYKPLQLFLRRILITDITNANMVGGDELEMNAEALKNLVKYSIIIVSSLPILILYPFLQKYFEKGMLIGSVKG
jgi:ABC-type glycerol-3-phosphate transport system permease component